MIVSRPLRALPAAVALIQRIACPRFGKIGELPVDVRGEVGVEVFVMRDAQFRASGQSAYVSVGGCAVVGLKRNTCLKLGVAPASHTVECSTIADATFRRTSGGRITLPLSREEARPYYFLRSFHPFDVLLPLWCDP